MGPSAAEKGKGKRNITPAAADPGSSNKKPNTGPGKGDQNAPIDFTGSFSPASSRFATPPKLEGRLRICVLDCIRRQWWLEGGACTELRYMKRELIHAFFFVETGTDRNGITPPWWPELQMEIQEGRFEIEEMDPKGEIVWGENLSDEQWSILWTRSGQSQVLHITMTFRGMPRFRGMVNEPTSLPIVVHGQRDLFYWLAAKDKCIPNGPTSDAREFREESPWLRLKFFDVLGRETTIWYEACLTFDARVDFVLTEFKDIEPIAGLIRKNKPRGFTIIDRATGKSIVHPTLEGRTPIVAHEQDSWHLQMVIDPIPPRSLNSTSKTFSGTLPPSMGARRNADRIKAGRIMIANSYRFCTLVARPS